MLTVFYQTLDYNAPKWQLDASLIGNNPGLGFRPMPPESNVESTLIWYKTSDKGNYGHWVRALDNFLESKNAKWICEESMKALKFHEILKFFNFWIEEILSRVFINLIVQSADFPLANNLFDPFDYGYWRMKRNDTFYHFSTMSFKFRVFDKVSRDPKIVTKSNVEFAY